LPRCRPVPSHHKIGDTVDVIINGDPAKLTWQDAKTLVINDHDRRTIINHDDIIDGVGKPCHSFVCSDADGSTEFTIIR
jgi:hypothetical protein